MYLVCSVDVVPIVESAPSAQVPTLLKTSTSHHNNHEQHRVSSKERDDRQEVAPGGDDDRTRIQTRNTESIISHSHSHDFLTHSGCNNTDTSGIGSNTESQEDLLDKNHRNKHNTNELTEKLNSGSKVADLITSYEESSKLSQSSSDSVKISRKSETGRRGKVGRVVSMVTEHSSKPQTLILQEVRETHACIICHCIYHDMCSRWTAVMIC